MPTLITMEIMYKDEITINLIALDNQQLHLIKIILKEQLFDHEDEVNEDALDIIKKFISKKNEDGL